MVQRKQAEMDPDASPQFTYRMTDPSDFNIASFASNCSTPLLPSTSNTTPNLTPALENYSLQTAQLGSELTDELFNAEHAYKSDLLCLTTLKKQLDQAKGVFKLECKKIAQSLKDQHRHRVNSDATISKMHTVAFYKTYTDMQSVQEKYDTAQSHVLLAKNKMDTLKSYVDKVAKLAKLSEQIELKLSIKD